MAYFRKRKLKTITTILACVRRVGHKPIYKSFAKKKDAQKWARAIERKIDTGGFFDYGEASKQTLGDIIGRYVREGKTRSKKRQREY